MILQTKPLDRFACLAAERTCFSLLRARIFTKLRLGVQIPWKLRSPKTLTRHNFSTLRDTRKSSIANSHENGVSKSNDDVIFLLISPIVAKIDIPSWLTIGKALIMWKQLKMNGKFSWKTNRFCYRGNIILHFISSLPLLSLKSLLWVLPATVSIIFKQTSRIP